MDHRLASWLMISILQFVGATALQAQDCIAVPADDPATGSPSSTPFGNNNPSDPPTSRYRSDTSWVGEGPRNPLGVSGDSTMPCARMT